MTHRNIFFLHHFFFSRQTADQQAGTKSRSDRKGDIEKGEAGSCACALERTRHGRGRRIESRRRESERRERGREREQEKHDRFAYIPNRHTAGRLLSLSVLVFGGLSNRTRRFQREKSASRALRKGTGEAGRQGEKNSVVGMSGEALSEMRKRERKVEKWQHRFAFSHPALIDAEDRDRCWCIRAPIHTHTDTLRPCVLVEGSWLLQLLRWRRCGTRQAGRSAHVASKKEARVVVTAGSRKNSYAKKKREIHEGRVEGVWPTLLFYSCKYAGGATTICPAYLSISGPLALTLSPGWCSWPVTSTQQHFDRLVVVDWLFFVVAGSAE